MTVSLAPIAPPAVTISPLTDPTPDQRILFDRLAALNLPHTTYDHAPVFTMAESDFLKETIPRHALPVPFTDQ